MAPLKTWLALSLTLAACSGGADVADPAALQRLSRHGAPAWTNCYDMRFAPGEEPFRFDGQEQPHARSRLWVRDEPPRPLDFPALASLCDSFFPRVFIRRRKFAPIGTVTLTTYFHADAAALLAPCAQLLPELAGTPLAPYLATRTAEFQARCAALVDKGWINGADSF